MAAASLTLHRPRARRRSDYVCRRDDIRSAGAKCQSIPGAGIDRAVGALLVELMTPVIRTVALKVQDELTARANEDGAVLKANVLRGAQATGWWHPFRGG